MGISINGGTPKSSMLIGSSLINHPFLGYPPFMLWNGFSLLLRNKEKIKTPKTNAKKMQTTFWKKQKQTKKKAKKKQTTILKKQKQNQKQTKKQAKKKQKTSKKKCKTKAIKKKKQNKSKQNKCKKKQMQKQHHHVYALGSS